MFLNKANFPATESRDTTMIRPRLRHEKHRSSLFSRVDLLNRTDADEAVRNVEYML